MRQKKLKELNSEGGADFTSNRKLVDLYHKFMQEDPDTLVTKN